jgi:hypothetical protein
LLLAVVLAAPALLVVVVQVEQLSHQGLLLQQSLTL